MPMLRTFAPLLSLVVLALAHSAPVSRGTSNRLVRFGPEAEDTALVSTAALEFLHDQLHGNERSSITHLKNHPLFKDINPRLLDSLAGEHFGCGPGFIDLTDATEPDVNGVPPPDAKGLVEDEAVTVAALPTPNPSSYPELQTMFTAISGSGLTSTVQTLSTNFTTRYYRSTVARSSALWIQQQFVAAVGSSNVQLVENTFDQPNVVGIIPAAAGSTNTETVIIGAHLDSINQSGGATAAAPGADDDASGVAVVLQALQILAASGWRGARRIEFHTYGGEEGGLLGAARTASQYKSAGRVVRGMLQLDMVGYQPSTKPIIAVQNDTYIPAEVQTFFRSLVTSYIGSEATLTSARCGYGCSDHYAWIQQGYPAGLLIEANLNALSPYYHTARDTLSTVTMTKATVYVKAALAFAVEMSGRA